MSCVLAALGRDTDTDDDEAFASMHAGALLFVEAMHDLRLIRKLLSQQ